MEAIPFAIPDVEPLKFASGQVHTAVHVLVRVHTGDGVTGVGEVTSAVAPQVHQRVDAHLGVGEFGGECVAQPVHECAAGPVSVDPSATKSAQHATERRLACVGNARRPTSRHSPSFWRVTPMRRASSASLTRSRCPAAVNLPP